jgi:hypothetical protein
MAPRLIHLRWAADCVVCAAHIDPGADGWWDATAKATTCEACHGGDPSPEAVRPALEKGVAGGSARREYGRRAARELARQEKAVLVDAERRRRDKEARPLLGRLASALTPRPVLGVESQSTRAWAVGAAGEERVAEVLDAAEGVHPLHDLGIPGSRANVDHVAVGPSGIFVIDAKKYSGAVQKRDVGGWFRTDERLYVNGRNRTNLVVAMQGQVEEIRRAVGDRARVPIIPVLCFVAAEWPLRFRPLRVGGVTVTRPQALVGLITSAGPLTEEDAARLADVIGRALPAATLRP